MIRVLQVVPYYAPAWAFGGPPKVMWEEARALTELGADVEVITTDAFDGTKRVERPVDTAEEGIRIQRLQNRSNWLAYHRYRFTPRGLRRALQQSQADVIHLSETRHELAIAAARHSKRRDVPLVLSAFGTLPRRGGAGGALRRIYDVPFVTPMLRKAAALLAQTDHEADLYIASGGDADRVHLLPLGTDDPPPPNGTLEIGLPADVPVVAFLGRIHQLKGVDRLIRGFARVAERHPEARLVIAGRDDGALAEAQRLAADLRVSERVLFPGPIYGSDRYGLYRRASLFAITPTHYEETSLASLEAASVGTAVFVSAEADVPFLEEFGGGWVLPAGADAAEVLDEALSSDLDAAGQGARRMIEAKHRWPVVGAQLLGILEAAV